MRIFPKTKKISIKRSVKIKKGDIVEVISGVYRKKQGKVLKVFPLEQKCIVEGVNFRIKHQRPISPESPSGRLKKEGTINISNLKLVCPKCGRPTRVGRKRTENKIVRICKKCGEMIDE
jgi:large subunit ribosomal protein L24